VGNINLTKGVGLDLGGGEIHTIISLDNSLVTLDDGSYCYRYELVDWISDGSVKVVE
jgi:hypothetical protein